jgi:asparagine synthase (glutamine-hydrolysing)
VTFLQEGFQTGVHGIAGIIGTGSQGQSAVQAMVGCMQQRPEDATGVYTNESVGLSAGWISRSGRQAPFWNERHDVCLLFSGEEFPADTGGEKTANRASELASLYENFGIKFLEKLNGTFRGVLIDLQERNVWVFNDRYGIHRVYYYDNGDGFYFASEAKALLKVLPEARRLDVRGMGELLSCGCVLQNRTLFRGINLLPPGSAWKFAPGQPAKRETYFKPETWERQPVLSPAEFQENLKATWSRALPRYFAGGERVAVSLTGGVDSRMILAWARGQVPCFTFGGSGRECADVKVAREVAKICGQPHEVIPINGEFLPAFPGLAEKAVYLSDGGMDVTGAIDLYVQRRARQIAPVRVTGTNGGEMLRRLVVFGPKMRGSELFAKDVTDAMQGAAATYAQELQGNRLTFTAFKQAPWFMGPKFVVERDEVTLRMPYFDNDLIALLYQCPAELIEDNGVSLRVTEAGNPRLRDLATDRGGGRAQRWFQEFTFKAEYAFDYGMPQWLARLDRVFAPLHLEKAFLGRHKIHHFRLSYRDDLGKYIQEVLLDERTLNRPYLNRRAVERVVREHVEGSGNYTREIHKLLSTELSVRKLIELN